MTPAMEIRGNKFNNMDNSSKLLQGEINDKCSKRNFLSPSKNYEL